MQHAACAFERLGNQTAARSNRAFRLVPPFPVRKLDRVIISQGHNGHRLGMGNPGQQQIRQPAVQFRFAGGSGDHIREVTEDLQATIRVTISNPGELLPRERIFLERLL